MPINSFLYPGAKFTPPYEVANSLRFNDASSDHLTRTQTNDSSNTKFNFSVWIKRSNLGASQVLYATQSGSDEARVEFNGSDQLFWYKYNGSSFQWSLRTNRVFRDTSAWYHINLKYDSTQGTDSNRLKMYINGVEETSFDQSGYPSSSENSNFFQGATAFLGCSENTADFFDGYMAEYVILQGQALDPTSFGEFDSDTNIWKPIDVSGLTFGNNGFYLDFENSGSLGADVSGNGNNFTVNNLTSIDQSTDTCTNNFATFNPLLDVNATPTLSEGNLKAQGQSSGNARFSGSTISVANGKWYYEIKVTKASSSPYCGILDSQSKSRRNSIYFLNSDHDANNPSGFAVNMSGDIYHNNSSTYATSIGSISTGDILGFAIDMDSSPKTMEIYKNGVSQRSFNIDDPPSGFYMLACISSYNEASAIAEVNFGSPPFSISSGNSDANGYGNFEYSVPSGYYSICTKNLAEYG